MNSYLFVYLRPWCFLKYAGFHELQSFFLENVRVQVELEPGMKVVSEAGAEEILLLVGLLQHPLLLVLLLCIYVHLKSVLCMVLIKGTQFIQIYSKLAYQLHIPANVYPMYILKKIHFHVTYELNAFTKR